MSASSKIYNVVVTPPVSPQLPLRVPTLLAGNLGSLRGRPPPHSPLAGVFAAVLYPDTGGGGAEVAQALAKVPEQPLAALAVPLAAHEPYAPYARAEHNLRLVADAYADGARLWAITAARNLYPRAKGGDVRAQHALRGASWLAASLAHVDELAALPPGALPASPVHFFFVCFLGGGFPIHEVYSY
jgi:hypothetical protein